MDDLIAPLSQSEAYLSNRFLILKSSKAWTNKDRVSAESPCYVLIMTSI